MAKATFISPQSNIPGYGLYHQLPLSVPLHSTISYDIINIDIISSSRAADEVSTVEVEEGPVAL